MDKWVKELKTLSTNCEFAEEDNMIRDKIVFGYRDPKVKQRTHAKVCYISIS